MITTPERKFTIGFMADSHLSDERLVFGPADKPRFKAEYFEEAVAQATDVDVIVHDGDIVDKNASEAARRFAIYVLGHSPVPVVVIRGNHDPQSFIRQLGSNSNITILEGEEVVLTKNLSLAGGTGGYDGSWGIIRPENMVKVEGRRQAHDKSVSRILDGIKKSDAARLVVATHYLLSKDLIGGEYPYTHYALGSDRLESVLEDPRIVLATCGHAHMGNLETTSSSGAPIYNVSPAIKLRLYRQENETDDLPQHDILVTRVVV